MKNYGRVFVAGQEVGHLTEPPDFKPALPVIEDKVWCDVQNRRVGVSVCASSCASPEHRPVCWLGRIYRDEPQEGGGG